MTKPTLRRRPLCPDLSLPADLHPVLARVYAARVQDASALSLTWDALPSFSSLTDLPKAAERLARAITQSEHIVIAGDYDADGATATAVLVRAIQGMGGQVTFLVPDRRTEGYGLTVALAQRSLALNPRLLITVDNGTSSHDGVATMQAAGVPVIVTDHHLPGPTLPAAYAIVNPQRSGDRYPGKGLAGVGVAFALAVTTKAVLKDQGWAQADMNMGALLDLVALGTVADVVPLEIQNRILVAQGLRRLRAGQGSPGILALIKVAGRDPSRLEAQDLGFTVGPRLNAAGRLEDMALGIRCLLTDDHSEALALARQLDTINRERRTIEDGMRGQAEAMVDRLQLDDGKVPIALCLHDPDWHEGVVGLVAGRIKDKVHRPTVAFAVGSDGLLKGSARSVPGVRIRDVLALIDTDHPDLIIRFGGHDAAAGLTLNPQRLADFQAAWVSTVSRLAGPDALTAVLDTDGPLASHEITMETAEALQDGGPWGQGFPAPLFEGHFRVEAIRPLSDGLHARLTVSLENGGGQPLTALAFHCERLGWTPCMGPLTCLYRIGINEYNGRRDLQLIVEAVT
ncbi:MAG: single-stranded-DNA-specific exonuclease RecJ [Acidiferrobacter sp.]